MVRVNKILTKLQAPKTRYQKIAEPTKFPKLPKRSFKINPRRATRPVNPLARPNKSPPIRPP